jgi:shikimate dehydrogenase
VLGAGGSARAAVWALADAGASDISIWNRTPERAAELALEFGAKAVGQPPTGADILVNCTSVGLHHDDELEALLLRTHALDKHRAVVDFVYRDGGTPLTRAAQASGVPTIDGLELLIGQGAIAFELFTGIAPSVEAMRNALGG